MTEQPLAEQIQVVAGNPSAEDLAAVIAILQATLDHDRAKASKKQVKSSNWHRNPQQLRGELRPGPGQWKSAFQSGLN